MKKIEKVQTDKVEKVRIDPVERVRRIGLIISISLVPVVLFMIVFLVGYAVRTFVG